MSQLSQGDQRELVDALNRFAERTDRLLQSSGNSNANISFNAGGVGLWAAVTCAVVCGVLTLAMSAAFIVLVTKYDRMQDYLNAIYMQAPHLKPPEST